jgi:N6-L-threonylcarbamoyladenine synthase
MLVLGIESSCDETAVAVVRNGNEILSNVIATQTDLHEPFGGVIPELACRRHVDIFPQILQRALDEAGVKLSDIHLISVTMGPGLIGALLVGLNFAKGLALSCNIPFVGVNHVLSHLYASMYDVTLPLPSLGVIVSGGHTALLLMEEHSFKLIGQTQDDAIGEAFDKVARLLDLPYPGGPKVEELAKKGNPHRFPLKVGAIKERSFDFSFSGLKTGVLYLVKGQNASKKSPTAISEEDKCDVAASFQQAALSDIVNKTLLAAKEYRCQSIVIGGGVSQNQTFRSLFDQKNVGHPIFWPKPHLCCDNAAMIAILGFHEFQKRGRSDSFELEAQPRIPFE